MTDHEKNLILAVVKHHLPPHLRRIVIREASQAYNAWMGGEFVKVVHTSDGRDAR